MNLGRKTSPEAIVARVDRGTRQRGFTVVAAIFLLVVLAALGAFLLSVSSMQHMGHAYDIQGSRAYQGARSGIEWGLYQVLQGPGTCPAPTNLVPGGISGMTVTVSCSSTTDDELGTPVTVYVLVSTACNQPAAGACPGAAGDGYVERQISTVAAR